MLSEHLLSILACPVCKGELSLFDEGRYLLCRPCGLRFPVREGIPVLLADEAEAMAQPALRRLATIT
ncbi:MAG: Trm112 family protein [Oryzomonas sp.]